jgi:hypothetical protein
MKKTITDTIFQHATNSACHRRSEANPSPYNPVEQLWQQIKQRFLSNTTFQNYDDVIERSCQAWNEILSENGFIKNLCSREWSFLV